MKKIEAVIREEKLQEVRTALEAEGFVGMTVYDVKGRGAQGGISLQWRVGDYRIDLLPKKMIVLVTKDQDYQKAIDIICKFGKSGSTGDGKIFVSTIDEVIRVRTEEYGEKAI